MRRGLVLAALVLSACLPAAATAASRVDVRTAVTYGSAAVTQPQAGAVPLLLDVYAPAGRSPKTRPAVLLIHGGGFANGSRTEDQMQALGRGLARRGIVAFSIDYRLMGQAPVPSPRVAAFTAAAGENALLVAASAAIDDALTALDWVRANARRWNVDPARLGLIGGSAGAIVADEIAYVAGDLGVAVPRLRFVASLWGGLLLPTGDPATPAAHLDRGDPALFAMHSAVDERVPVALDDALVARARAVGVPVEYLRVDDGAHGFVGIDFFARDLGGGVTPFDRLMAFAVRQLR